MCINSFAIALHLKGETKKASSIVVVVVVFSGSSESSEMIRVSIARDILRRILSIAIINR